MKQQSQASGGVGSEREREDEEVMAVAFAVGRSRERNLARQDESQKRESGEYRTRAARAEAWIRNYRSSHWRWRRMLSQGDRPV